MFYWMLDVAVEEGEVVEVRALVVEAESLFSFRSGWTCAVQRVLSGWISLHVESTDLITLLTKLIRWLLLLN